MPSNSKIPWISSNGRILSRTAMLWESLGGSLFAGLYNGGPVALAAGFNVLGTSICSSAAVPTEFSTPVAGAQYHWTFDLAPVATQMLSLLQGWLTVELNL
ncbi:cc6c4ecf-9c24-457a-b7b9-1a6eff2c97ac [Sclerotinia trifoliorum]|uniref:Cc6c4ecf-9c24-457a-b7b9-1a6eff2c97ac n=1 Tax=Sclerotinia trifoliorum TaxID=28548 RepID=A0A8H2W3K3_9HELO|nr:cc6c4ecf-9c24-457a-b7b9-1a6eff2c97ac [Sclerotinia trifoliorum]